MLSLDAERIQSSLLCMKGVSKILKVVFRVVFVLYTLIAILLFGTSLVKMINPASVLDSAEAFGLGSVPMLLSKVIVCVTLFVLARLFEDISKGESPFTLAQAKRIAVIGCLLAIGVVVEGLVFSGSSMSLTVANVVDLRYSAPPSDNQLIYINGTYVVGAVLCFCLSYAFRYGALLQRLSDDTV